MEYTKKENTVFEVFIGKTFDFNFADFINQTAMNYIEDINANDSILFFGNIELDLCFQFKSSFNEQGECFELIEIYYYPKSSYSNRENIFKPIFEFNFEIHESIKRISAEN